MRAMGASDDDIAAAEVQRQVSAADADVFDLWASNWKPFQLFTQGLATQWQYAGMGAQRTGLNYAGVQAYLDIHLPRKKWRKRFADVQLMERAVLVADREILDQKGNT